MPCPCPRCGSNLEFLTVGGNYRKGHDLARVLICTNSVGCIGPLSADYAPGGALAPVTAAA